MGTNQQRDADMDRLLRAVLKPASHERADAGTVHGRCPDAAMLAAFVEASLSPDEQSALDAHIVQCGPCQEVLAILAADQPREEDAAPVAGWFTWVTRPRLRWLVPITAATTVAAVFLVSRPLIAPEQISPASEVARMAQAPSQSAEAPPLEDRLERDRVVPGAKPTGEAVSRPAIAERQGNEVKEEKLAAAAAPVPTLSGETAREKSAAAGRAAETPERAVADEKRARAAAEPAGAPAAAPAAEQLAVAPPPANVPRATVATQKAVAMDAESAVRSQAAPKKDAAKLESGQFTLSAPGGVVQWRFGGAGRIARSGDGGATWHDQASGVSADLLAGSAPSPATCWVVGAAGTVLLTRDGERWERRPFPVAADLIAVQATGARTATVTTRDGRRFDTLDAGSTWSQR